MNRFTWRHQYDDDSAKLERERTDLECKDPSLTQQQFTKDADLNEIMRRFGVTDGAITPVAIDPRYFGDFSDAPDFRQALDNTRDALERFNMLPADLRKRFNNDPVELFAFVSDPANTKEAVELKLLKPLEQTPPSIDTPK